MEQNIHVTRCRNKVQKEISFIFPNYIHETIYCPEQMKFCVKNPLVESTITTLYDIVTNPDSDPHKSWKQKLVESIISKNKALPHISNQCCHSLQNNLQDVGQQTKISCLKYEKVHENALGMSPTSDPDKDCSSLNFTTSSCVTCSGFDSGADCMKQTDLPTLGEIIKVRTAPLSVPVPSSSSTTHTVQEEFLEDFNSEEHVAAEDFAVLVEDQVLDDDQNEKELQIEKEAEVEPVLIKSDKEDNGPNDNAENVNDIAENVNDIAENVNDIAENVNDIEAPVPEPTNPEENKLPEVVDN